MANKYKIGETVLFEDAPYYVVGVAVTLHSVYNLRTVFYKLRTVWCDPVTNECLSLGDVTKISVREHRIKDWPHAPLHIQIPKHKFELDETVKFKGIKCIVRSVRILFDYSYISFKYDLKVIGHDMNTTTWPRDVVENKITRYKDNSANHAYDRAMKGI